MVNVPVVATLAMDDPDTIPVRPDASTAALAGPPRKRPSMAKATCTKYSAAPALSSSAPNRTNRKTKSVETPSGTPQMPLSERYMWSTTKSRGMPGCARNLGIIRPMKQ